MASNLALDHDDGSSGRRSSLGGVSQKIRTEDHITLSVHGISNVGKESNVITTVLNPGSSKEISASV